MIYSRAELEAKAKDALKGKTPKAYLDKGCKLLVGMLQKNPDYWKAFGPYYGVLKGLLAKYQPTFHQPKEWAEVPNYLSHYDMGDDLLNLVAVLAYLNRDGDYMQSVEHPHSITMPNGDNKLFIPGTGIIET